MDEEVKEHRLQRVIRRNQIDSLARNQRYLNRIEEILVTDVNPRNPKQVEFAAFKISPVVLETKKVICPKTEFHKIRWDSFLRDFFVPAAITCRLLAAPEQTESHTWKVTLSC